MSNNSQSCTGPRIRRALVRALGALLVAGPVPVAPATIPVGGACDLAEAIENANADAAVNADCAAGSGADVLQLSGNVTLTSVDNSTDGDNGLPSITSEITIEGGGFTVERDAAAPDFRIFHVASDGDLTLESTTVGAGRIGGVNGAGGGIFARGMLTLSGSVVANNLVSTSSYAYGGGIYVYDGGALGLASSTISGNRAEGEYAYGGGVFGDFGSYVISVGSSISTNEVEAGYVGGGGLEGMGFTSLTETTVADNQAHAAGSPTPTVFAAGVHAPNGLTLIRSTVSGNAATADGEMTLVFGGGLRVDGILSMTNSTVSGNSVTAVGTFGVAYGAGLLQLGSGTATLSTFAGNSVSASYPGGAAIHVEDFASLSLVSSLLGQSVGENCEIDGTLNDIQNNLTDDNTCGSIPNALTDLDPLLLDNGGPTETHALLEGSSAIDHAGTCGIVTDQRGVDRDDPDGCDSGAYERAECMAPDGYSETTPDLVTTETILEVCRTIDTGASLTVAAPGGVLILRAGVMVSLGDGTVVEDGAVLEVEIDPNLDM